MRLKLKRLLERLFFNLMKLLGFKVVHFLHIGKTGGTAIKAAFLEKGVFFKKMRICKKYLFVLHKHDFHLDKVRPNEYVFFVIRDPVERFISGFNSRFRQGLPRKFNPWTQKERKVFEVFDSPNKLAEGLSSEDSGIKQQAISAMGTILHVRNSVWEWFINEDFFINNKSKILFVLRQSNLNQDFNQFKQKLGIEIGNLPVDPVISHKSPQGIEEVLSNTAFINIRNWYKRDFDFIDFIRLQGFVK